MSVAVSSSDAEMWRSWIGKTETRTEVLEVESVRRYAAAIQEDLAVEKTLPSLAHWAFFLPVVESAEIGADGHPKRGGFLPPISLPRRMFASSSMRFGAGLTLGQAATRVSTIAEVKHRPGRSGDLMLVGVEHVISQASAMCVTERQTLVYRGDVGRTPAVVPIAQAIGTADQLWQPGPVDLFRFSAVTFNSHRIHYDVPYATEAEGYPGLVVHGPFTAAKLYGYARSKGPPSGFAFRATAPIFVSQPVRLTQDSETSEFRAVRCDGTVAMSAVASR